MYRICIYQTDNYNPEFRCYEAKIEEREMASSHQDRIEPKTPSWPVQPVLCHWAIRTTTGQPPALSISYMYCTAGGTEMPQSHAWQQLSMCRQWHILSGRTFVVVQWQSTDCTSQVSWVWFPATAGHFTFLYFHHKSKFSPFQREARVLSI